MNEKELAFIGKITAGVTHEVNNVLASIREISGLMADILSITSSDSFSHKEKFESSVKKIQNQENRGVKLISQLNKFAHLPDVISGEIDLNDMIEHLLFLTERFGRIKNIQIQLQSSQQDVKISSKPFYLQMALFNCIEYFLNKLNSGGKIYINYGKSDKGYLIEVTGEGEYEENENPFNDLSSAELLILNEIIPFLNGELELDNANRKIKIFIPIGN